MHLDTLASTDFAILSCIMSPDAPASQPSGKDRREYYRITVTLPIRIQPETDTTEGALIEQSVNISGGGLGVTVSTVYEPNDILSVTLRLPDHGLFTSFAEVLRLDPIPYPGGTYRLHARFIRMTTQEREVLIRHILRFQRDHLQEHYSA
ncbi:MAG: PilZ domain-containing protein [Nitrospira sp. CG24D]|nr:MAG: PilZ domain-containing protein [Nitrospira sp. CG24D]